ncbi:MAG: ribosome biogenesis GTPase YlqF [Bacillota bacterium]
MKKEQWYPGNMARAMRQLGADLKLMDLVVELLDARVPISSRNPALSRLIGDRDCLILLHKADRAEPAVTARWLSYFQRQDLQAVPFSVFAPAAYKTFHQTLKSRAAQMGPSRLKKPLRLMITGIPNVGKSTLINLLVKKAAARTGNRPGITRGRQWIRLMPGIELLDTPGVLWPNLSAETAVPLAVVGALPPSRLDIQNLALWLLNFYRQRGFEELLLKRYALPSWDEPEAVLERIGAGQGCLQSAGKIDLDRAAALLLRDFQSGTLGRLTLEEPPV